MVGFYEATAGDVTCVGNLNKNIKFTYVCINLKYNNYF
jgi:hypothetical protein